MVSVAAIRSGLLNQRGNQVLHRGFESHPQHNIICASITIGLVKLTLNQCYLRSNRRGRTISSRNSMTVDERCYYLFDLGLYRGVLLELYNNPFTNKTVTEKAGLILDYSSYEEIKKLNDNILDLIIENSKPQQPHLESET